VTDVLRSAAANGAVGDSCALAALLRADPRALDDAALVGNLAFILEIAHDNASGLLVWSVQMLGSHPAALDRLRTLARDAPADAASLARGAVLETLRLEQSEYLYRVATRDLAFDGFTIPAGWFVRICVRESHRSADAFADPERFDPTRFAGPPPPETTFAPFGLGPHACIGGALTLTLGRMLVEALAGREWRIVAGGARTRIRWRHWGHWMPSRALRIVVSPRRGGPPAC
jgi:cytochrome P450